MAKSTLVAAALAAALALPAGAHAGLGQNGASGVGDPFFPTAGNGGYEVGRYELDLRYRPASGRLRATARLDATVELEAASLARFNLDYSGPRVRAVRVAGEPAAFARQGSELVVTPADPLADGQPFRTVVRYAGRPGPVTDPDGSKEGWIRTPDGAIAVGEPLGSPAWFPANNHPTDKAAFKIAVTTPRGTLGVSNGRLVERDPTRRSTTTVWEQDEPMATYLATLAIGRFRIDRGTVGGAAYLAVVDRRFDGGDLRRLRERTRRSHAFMAGIAGPYPFGATGGIVDPSSVGYALETQARPYYPGPPPLDLVVHEISHQWYGNSVSIAEWDEIWLNEGFATYMEWLYVERHGGSTTAAKFDELYAAHGAGDNAFWNPPPANPGTPAKLFAESIYTRGAMALQVLREELGDVDFFALLEQWATGNQYGAVTTDDLRALIESFNGGVVPASFEEWITEPGRPDLP